MSWFRRAQAAVPTPRGGPSALTWLLLAAVLCGVGAVAIYSRNVVSSPSTHSVTVTAPQAPSVTLPKIDGATQAELVVLSSGSGWDGTMKAAALWLLDRLLWLSVPGLVVAVVFWSVPFLPTTWGRRLGVGCAVLIGFGLIGPVAIVLLEGGVAARDAVVVQHLPSPTPPLAAR